MGKPISTILDGQINFPLCLAPMVGLTHVALREVMREYLPEDARTIWPTEMLNSRRIPAENLSTTPETMRSSAEDFLIPQILGNEEIPIAKSVERLIEWGAQGIDINMGCPVQKALKHNYGVALMGDPQYASDVVRMTVKHSRVPVSVKLRAVGSTSSLQELKAFAQGLQDAGASWLCLHPRTAAQKRRGHADWSQIKWLNENIAIPLIGNGDVQTFEDAMQMLDETGATMAMSGRALAARPWMLWQLGEELGFQAPLKFKGQKAPRTPAEEGAEYGRCFLNFVSACEKYFPHDLALRKIRFYVRTTSVWLLFGQSLISISTKSKTISELKEKSAEFFSAEQIMVQRTELRQ